MGAAALGIVPAVGIITSIFGGKNDGNNNNQKYESLERELSRQIEDLKYEKRRMEQINQERTNKIMELEQKLLDNIEEQNKREIQRQLELEKQKQIEHSQKMEELKKKQEAINKCKEFFSFEFSISVVKAIDDFYSDRDKWIESFSDINLDIKLEYLKKQLIILFNDLFNVQKIYEQINNKFIKLLENNVNLKKLNQMNYLVIGTSGVGKSTLINELLGEQVAKEGVGTRCTTMRKRYESEKYPFLTFTDSMGTEIGSGYTLEEVESDTLKEITSKLNENNPNEIFMESYIVLLQIDFLKMNLK